MFRLRSLVFPALAISVAFAPLAAQAPVTVKLGAADKVGAEPKTFLPIVGDWVITQDEGKKVVMVDGRKWKRGQPAGGLADKAREIYGARNEDFIDNVAAFAYYPTAVAKDIPNFENGEISVKFKMIGGALDRAQGIMFNLKPNGDWLAVRYNGTEDNLVLWTYVNGKRSFTKRGTDNIPLELGTWHEIKLAVHGIKFTAYLDGKLLIEYDLKEPVNGKGRALGEDRHDGGVRHVHRDGDVQMKYSSMKISAALTAIALASGSLGAQAKNAKCAMPDTTKQWFKDQRAWLDDSKACDGRTIRCARP